MVLQTGLWAGLLSAAGFAALVLLGKFVIVTIAGPDYAAAYGPMLWLAVSGILFALTFPLEPMLISSGHVRATVIARLAAAIIYIPAFFTLTKQFGLLGAASASALYGVITALAFILFSLSFLRKRNAP